MFRKDVVTGSSAVLFQNLTLGGWQDDAEEEKKYEEIKTVYTPISATY
jgi:hypothetical protein